MQRSLFSMLVAGLVLVLTLGSAQAEPWSNRGFVLSEVDSAGPEYGFIAMGYVHHARPFQQVAIFRSRNRVYFPIGVARLDRVDATKSLFRINKESPARNGDLVVALERDLVPLADGGYVEDYFVRTHILSRGERNGYETGLSSQTASAFRTQSLELRNRRSDAWEQSFNRVKDVKLVIEKDPKKALILQLELFTEELQKQPKSLAGLSREWKQALLLLNRKVQQRDLLPGVNDDRIRLASEKFLPEQDDEAAQIIRVMIAHSELTANANPEAYIRSTLNHSQFAVLQNDDRFTKNVATYIQELLAEQAPAEGGM